MCHPHLTGRDGFGFTCQHFTSNESSWSFHSWGYVCCFFPLPIWHSWYVSSVPHFHAPALSYSTIPGVKKELTASLASVHSSILKHPLWWSIKEQWWVFSIFFKTCLQIFIGVYGLAMWVIKMLLILVEK